MSETELLERPGIKKSVDTGVASALLEGQQVGVAEARAKREEQEARERAEVQEKLESFPELVERMNREIAQVKVDLLDLKTRGEALKAQIKSNDDRMTGMRAALEKLGKNEIDSQVVEEHTTTQAALTAEALNIKADFDAKRKQFEALSKELADAKAFQEAVEGSGQ